MQEAGLRTFRRCDTFSGCHAGGFIKMISLPIYPAFMLFLTNWKTDPKGTSILWLLSHVTHTWKASMGMGAKEEQGEDKKGQLKGEWGGVQQSCSTLHTPVSTGSWMRLSWACKSSRLEISYSGSVSVQPDRRGRHSQEKRWERWKTTAVDKRAQLKEPVITFQPVPCNRAFGSDCCRSAHRLHASLSILNQVKHQDGKYLKWKGTIVVLPSGGGCPWLVGGDGNDFDM